MFYLICNMKINNKCIILYFKNFTIACSVCKVELRAHPKIWIFLIQGLNPAF
jgi:hypothetical protein